VGVGSFRGSEFEFPEKVWRPALAEGGLAGTGCAGWGTEPERVNHGGEASPVDAIPESAVRSSPEGRLALEERRETPAAKLEVR